jgi:hypothetical protein
VPSLTKNDETGPKPRLPEKGAKQSKGNHEFNDENKGDYHGSDVSIGMTDGMHGKSKGGHPSIRAQEFKKGDKGEGHHIMFGKNNEHKYGNQ